VPQASHTTLSTECCATLATSSPTSQPSRWLVGSITMPPARDGHVFVTVGTTEFDALVTVATSESFGRAAIQHGFTRLVVQYGRGKRPSPPQVRSCVLRRSHNTWPAIARTNTSAVEYWRIGCWSWQLVSGWRESGWQLTHTGDLLVCTWGHTRACRQRRGTTRSTPLPSALPTRASTCIKNPRHHSRSAYICVFIRPDAWPSLGERARG
jgi:hypothetical protein